MKIAIITDTHFGVRGDNEVFLKNQETFFKEVFFPTLKENNVNTILHLGDLFDKRKTINFYTLDLCKKFFLDEIKKQNYKMHLIAGNHDVFYKNTNRVNSLDLLLSDYKENISFYVNDIAELKFNNCSIAMVPWINSENSEKIFKQIKKTSCSYLFGHFEIQGFLMSAGNYCKHGIDGALFSGFDKVLSGHFHTESKKSNIHYIGTPYEMDWSDYGVKKGFYLLDTITKEMNFIENKINVHRIINFNDKDEKLNIKEIEDLELDTYKNSFVKIIVDHLENPASLEKFVKKIGSVELADLKVIDKTNLKKQDDEIEIDLDDEDTTKNLIKLSVNQKDFDDEKKNSIIDKLNKLYEEASKL